ncbi:hypothetical protein DL770_003954 [Monosporascus sp. CRB-9-2]|nr:hypothetical protein DL770_003954 [Monosporascus sp. CRB-9-2]
MGQKREGPPLVKQEHGPKMIKSEKFEDTKFDLRSIPRAPTTAFKVKEEADSKPKFNMTGPIKNGGAQKPGYTHEVDVVHGKWDRQKMPAVAAMLAPAPGLLHPPSLLFQAGPRGSGFGLTGVDTPPSGVTIKADEKDK